MPLWNGVQRVALIALVAATLLMVGGLLGRWLPAADLLNSFAPIWGIMGAVAALPIIPGAIVNQRWWRLLIVAMHLGATATILAPEYIGGTPPPPPSSSPPTQRAALRLLQFNAHKQNSTPREAAAWILRQDADVITMEEALGSSREIVRLLARSYPHQVSCLSRMRCSTVILSKRAPIATGGLARGDPEDRKTVSATWARFASRGRPLTIIAVHMARPWQWTERENDDQALMQFIQTQDRARLIIAGDFNLTPWSYAMQRQDRRYGLQRLTRALPSWPAYRVGATDLPPLMPIDHVYAGQDWAMRRIQRGPWLGSDHRPIVIDLSLSSAPSAARPR